jgi:hypothetical protein
VISTRSRASAVGAVVTIAAAATAAITFLKVVLKEII